MRPADHITSEETTACAGCGSNAGLVLLSAPGFDGGGECFDLRGCSACGLVSTWPAPTLETLEQAYRSEYYGADTSKFVGLVERWTRHAARRRAATLVASHAKAGGNAGGSLRVLDIGCGRGVLLEGFRALGHDATGVERKGSPFEGLPGVVCGHLAALDFAPASFDLIVLWHVLEHLDDPRETLRQAQRLLRPDGSLFISVPNFGSLQSRLFRGYWFHLDLPRHLFHFNAGAMTRLLAACGFTPREQGTFAVDQNLYGFVQSALNCVPGLPQNHLYRLLKARPSARSIGLILVYSPLLLVLAVPAVVEAMVSAIFARGATLTICARGT